MTKATKWHVRPAKTQISLGIHPVWSESSLSAWRKLGSLVTHWAHSEDSAQTGRMPRLISVFAWRTGHLVVFVMRRLILFCCLEYFIIQTYSSILAISYFVYLFWAFYNTVTCVLLQDKLVTVSAGSHGISCAIQTPSVLNYFEHNIIRTLLRVITLNTVTVSLKFYMYVFCRPSEKVYRKALPGRRAWSCGRLGHGNDGRLWRRVWLWRRHGTRNVGSRTGGTRNVGSRSDGRLWWLWWRHGWYAWNWRFRNWRR